MQVIVVVVVVVVAVVVVTVECGDRRGYWGWYLYFVLELESDPGFDNVIRGLFQT